MPENNITNSRNREELNIDFIKFNILNLTKLFKNVSKDLFINILLQILKENISVINISFPSSDPVFFGLCPRNIN
jgi:hypothetical protein